MDPEAVLGEEDLARMRVYSHGSARAKIREIRALDLQGKPLPFCAWAMLRAGFCEEEAAKALKVSARTIRRWKVKMEMAMGC